MAGVDRAGLVLAGVLALFSSTAFDQPASGNHIQVHVEGLRNDTGQVLCALFSSMDGFPNKPERAFARTRSVIAGRSAECDFSDIMPGTYAISVFHDENANGQARYGIHENPA